MLRVGSVWVAGEVFYIGSTTSLVCWDGVVAEAVAAFCSEEVGFAEFVAARAI